MKNTIYDINIKNKRGLLYKKFAPFKSSDLNEVLYYIDLYVEHDISLTSRINLLTQFLTAYSSSENEKLAFKLSRLFEKFEMEVAYLQDYLDVDISELDLAKYVSCKYELASFIVYVEDTLTNQLAIRRVVDDVLYLDNDTNKDIESE